MSKVVITDEEFFDEEYLNAFLPTEENDVLMNDLKENILKKDWRLTIFTLIRIRNFLRKYEALKTSSVPNE